MWTATAVRRKHDERASDEAAATEAALPVYDVTSTHHRQLLLLLLLLHAALKPRAHRYTRHSLFHARRGMA